MKLNEDLLSSGVVDNLAAYLITQLYMGAIIQARSHGKEKPPTAKCLYPIAVVSPGYMNTWA